MKLSTQTHFSQGWNTRLLEAIDGLGTDMIRDSVPWHKVEAARGDYDFGVFNAKWVEPALAAGFDVVLVFNPSNPLYDAGGTVYTAKGLKAFADFVVATLKQYPGIAAIEIGNEFNGNNFVTGHVASAPKAQRDEFYAKIVGAVDAALDAAGIAVEVIGASTHSVPVAYFADLVSAGALDHVDSVSIHPYTSKPEELADQLELLRTVIGRDIDIHATEFGGDFATLAEAPAYLAKMVSVMAAAGVASANWYAFAEQARFPNMELWDPDTSKPTPAGVTFKLLEAMLAGGGGAVKQIEVDSHTYFYSYGNSAILWGEARTIKLASGVTAYDLAGNRLKNLSSISPDQPIILRSNAEIGAASVSFGASALLADSYHDFDLTNDPGSLAGFEGPWSYFAESGKGKEVALSTMGGGQMAGESWNPYLSADWLRPLQVNAEFVLPAKFSAGNKPASDFAVVERFTATKAGTLLVTGHWDVNDATEDGVQLSVLVNGRTVLTKVIFDAASGHVFDLALGDIVVKAGDTIDFDIAARGNAKSDHTERRIQIYDQELLEKLGGLPDFDPVVIPDDPDPDPDGGGTGNNPFDQSGAVRAVKLTGTFADDIMLGGKGNDTISGGGGIDRISGGAGNDLLLVEAEDALIDGGAGTDTIEVKSRRGLSLDLAKASIEAATGGRGDDRFDGSAAGAKLVLRGEQGDDVLLGGSAADQIFGGTGNDLIDGGAGNDLLNGGKGADVFRFTGAFGRDTIDDFGKGDRIDLSAIAGIDSFADIAISYNAKRALISIGEHRISLTGVAEGTLDAGDFIL